MNYLLTFILPRGLLSLIVLLSLVWGALALSYRLTLPGYLSWALIGLWSLAGVGVLWLIWARPLIWAVVAYAVLMGVLLLWWQSLQPSNQRLWADDVAQMTHGRIEDNQLFLDNVRNFNWRSDEDYDVRWESRRYDLDKLKSIDLFTSYWGMPAIAHVLVSFGFEDGQQLLFSVEIRKEKNEKYSEIGGFFKEFELSIVATDERDAVRVRTNVRGEDVYLYRLNMPPEAIRELLVQYVEQANELVEQPRFYNTVTANCTTIVYHMLQNIVDGLKFDHRLLLTGYLPSYVGELGGLQAGYSLDELREAGRITERAKAADQSPEFSRLIRQGVPGWLGQE
ncbi:Lnb N-terminal periplasmic domain-containing protein [Pseudomonas sp. TTU2014-080ASC]|uniref:Lnb N-terminal periplasmic domain-containing protein n=1 Tax=Pseudomonas sp. TTU2014-080ASC TaxID=1729724 RepID=UPI000718A393|nr:DUF4105 domain-containing protein [Pseudomonas sp. TTU2014-080ASC]KRW58557.1 hypothetical protein AO726_17105 [Pseudomonas sp. TTU2014-080ASC]